MPKGILNKRYALEFKKLVIESMDYCNNRGMKAKLEGLPPAIHRQQALSAV